MLEKIREGSHGTVAKVVLGLVILSFALAGVGSYIGQPVNLVAAIVNGEEVERTTFENAFQNERSRMERQFGDYFAQMIEDPAYLQEFRRSVLQRLVDEVLVNQAVAELEIRVSDEQIKQEIRSTPQFQADGHFSNDLYLNFIRRSGFSPSQFRELLRSDLNRRQLLSTIAESEFVVPQQLQLRHRLESQTRDIRYVEVDASMYEAGVDLTDDDIQTFYEDNMARFKEPEKISLEYVELRASDLKDQVEVSDSEVEDYYTDRLVQYQTIEQRKVAHILFTGDAAEKQAVDALMKINAGDDFSTLAENVSQDSFSATNGGELDWFERGVMDPAFEEAAFSLSTEGELSQPVKSAFGYHLIKLIDERPATTKPLSEVQEQVRDAVRNQKALDLFFDRQQVLTDLAFEVPDTLSDAAEEIGVEVKTTSLFSRKDAPEPFNHPSLIRAAFSKQVLDDGMNSDLIEVAPEHVVVIRMVKHQQARTKPLDQIKSEIETIVRSNKALEQAGDMAESIKLKLDQGDEIGDLLLENNLTLSKKKGVKRIDNELAPGISRLAFSLARPADEVAVVASEISADRYAVVQVTQVNDPVEASESDIDRLMQSSTQIAQQMGYQQLLAGLRGKADIVYTENSN